MKLRLLVILSLAPWPLACSRSKRRNNLADAELPSLLTIYKDLHTHPELSTHEERSAAIVAKELKAAGCEVTEHVGKYDKAKRDLLRRHRCDEKRRRSDRRDPHRPGRVTGARRNRPPLREHGDHEE